MKKKIAFVVNGLGVGGIETALIQMLRKIDTDKYEISLFTNVEGNPCINQIPACIKVINLDDPNLKLCFFDSVRKGKIMVAARVIRSYLKIKLSKSELDKVKFSQEPFILSEEIFDCAIAYRSTWMCVLWVLNHIKAHKKVAWLHGAIWKCKDRKWIECVDKIFCVGEDVKRYIEYEYPSVIGRTEVFYNLMDSGGIIEKAGDGLDLGNEITLVTVGRLSSEKGQDMIPQTARLLIDAGYKFKWYIVGDGPLRATVEEKCREYDVTENVIFTGTLSNPYPYIKSCDIYVQTSYSEGYCTTTMEAKILGKTIVTTDAPGMREQFVNGVNGLIVEDMTPEALSKGIKCLLDDPSLCQKFMDALKEEKHDNSRELEKLYAFIES